MDLNNDSNCPPSMISLISPVFINSDNFSTTTLDSFGNWDSALVKTSNPLNPNFFYQ